MNLSTYGYTVLAAHTIGKDAYGAFSALMGALLVISVLSLGLQATGARRIAAHPDQVVAIERIVLGRRAAQRARSWARSAWRSRRCSTPCCTSTASRPRCWSASRRCRSPTWARRPACCRASAAGSRSRCVYLAQGIGRIVVGTALIADLAERVRRDGRRRARLLAARAGRLARAAAPAGRRTAQRGAPGPRPAPRGRAQQPGAARLLRPVERRHPGRPRDHVGLRGRPLRRAA